MAKKWRNAESYYGNTAEARKMQRSNLIPGGKDERRKIQGARYDCWWELSAFRNKQSILKTYENDRASKDVPEEELKGEDYLNNWWRDLSLESKISIYKEAISGLTKESRSEIFKDMEKCLKDKLEKGI
ncbi:hypothetical protein ES695_15235 [Candidatus Atribacteria bacterium 1244-E10-H5-B2]|nr:MAG: hypothetical protein ES695_15235 [Candidatus Atribacteria bacterium 1244-E10-H5-B2]